MGILRLFDILYYQLQNKPLEKSLATKKNGKWEYTSTELLIERVNKLSRGLLKHGVKPGDKIAIITATNRTEWLIIDYAVQQIGAVTVPIYNTLSNDDFIYVLNNSESILCFVSDKDLYHTIKGIYPSCPKIKEIFTFDKVEGAAHWTDIEKQGEEQDNQEEVEALKNKVHEDDLVTLIYTSGTTGKPKGVMLSHKNIVSNVVNSKERIIISPDKQRDEYRVLSFLPICHVLERMVLYLFMHRSYSIHFAESIDKLAENLKEVKPNFMTVVPRVIEKLYNAIYAKGTQGRGVKAQIFLWSIQLAEKYEPFTPKGFWHKIADKIVFKKWREGLGGEIISIVCGSAALSTDLNRVFYAAGLPIMEGYGLTETAPVIAVNADRKDLFKIGTVGPILKGVQVKIAEDGEILVKGPNVFKGYYKDEQKTKEAFTEDGWFMTGDIGNMDADFLTITDRKKEIFKTSGGKYITPQITENYLKQSRFIEQVMVVGDGEKMPCALIQPDFNFLKQYIKFKNLNISINSSLEELVNNPTIKNRVMKDVEKVNERLGHWEKIKKIELTPIIWSIEGGELTPTLKMRRKIIKEKYIQLYNKMYSK